MNLTVYKNTLVKRANAGTEYEGLDEALKGIHASSHSAKRMHIWPGLLKKTRSSTTRCHSRADTLMAPVYDAKQVEALADIPSREELIARSHGSIQSPLSQLVIQGTCRDEGAVPVGETAEA